MWKNDKYTVLWEKDTFSVRSDVRKHHTDRISYTAESVHNGARDKRKDRHTDPIFMKNFDILFIVDCWHDFFLNIALKYLSQ